MASSPHVRWCAQLEEWGNVGEFGPQLVKRQTRLFLRLTEKLLISEHLRKAQQMFVNLGPGIQPLDSSVTDLHVCQ